MTKDLYQLYTEREKYVGNLYIQIFIFDLRFPSCIPMYTIFPVSM